MIAALIVLFAAAASTSAVEVVTSLGGIRGVVLKTRLGEDFYAFRGIPYGNAPDGELRFKSPQPKSPWKPNVFDATEEGPMCPQFTWDPNEYTSEDCLRVNVYTKNLDEKASRPVLVYIHPGAFYSFSGQSKNNAGPELLMDRDVVFVTINYRLGTLGFLATGSADAPGNAGLKDQVLAFKWIQEHIRKFGGDPNSVTLMGYDAGGISVGLHMMSPMTKGLFHRGIVMSGAATSQIKYPNEQLDLAKKQAELVKCPTNAVGAMVKCLEKVPVQKLVNTSFDMFEFGYNPFFNWLPVVEKDYGQEKFITEDPTVAFQAGRFHRIPLIVGMTKDEFINVIQGALQNETFAKQINEKWETLAPIMLLYERNTPRSKEISTALRKKYLNNVPQSSKEDFLPLGKLFSDATVGFGVHRFAHLAARYVPVYYYRFAYRGRYSRFKNPISTGEAYGSVNHDDLLYLLKIPHLAPLFKKTDPEDKMVERLTRLWTQFARTGNPNNSKDQYLKDLNWKQLDLKEENYLDIGSELINKNGLFLERFDIWKNLFPLDWSGNHCKTNSGANLDYPDADEQKCH